jgi:hypothetical protein
VRHLWSICVIIILRYCEKSVKSGWSIKAETEDDSKLVGIRLTFISHKNEEEGTFRDYIASHGDKLCRDARLVIAWLAYTQENLTDVYKQYCVDSYVEFVALNVLREFCGRGIATTLMRLSFDLLASQPVDVFKVVTANPAVKHIYRDKFGFELSSEVSIGGFQFEGKHVLSDFQPQDAKIVCFTKKA